MNVLKISILIFLPSLIFFSCQSGEDKQTSSKNDTKKENLQAVSVNECIKRIIYFELQTDMEKYDSLATHYFHELKDYIEPEAIYLSKKIDSLKKIIHTKELDNANPYYLEIDSLKAELSPYNQFVIGYAFVHTFFDGQDTISGIFVMDTLCGFGEMTVLKETVFDDPIVQKEYLEKLTRKNHQ